MSEASKVFSDGEAYERSMGRWSRRIGELFVDWLDMPNGLHCLDVGCGNGAFTEVLMARCDPVSVVGLDPSEGQLQFAQQRVDATSARFKVGDASALPFDSDSFDAALMALVISFVPNPMKAVGEMARVVRPGGWVATYMWDLPGGGVPTVPLYRAAKSLGMSSSSTADPTVSRRDVLQKLWQQAGLQAIETSVFHTEAIYSDFDDFWNSNTISGPAGQWVGAMTPDTREQLRARAHEQNPTTADGTIRYDVFANAVKGRMPK